MVEKNIVLNGLHGRPVLLDHFHGSTDKPLVIFSHGFKGFKDWGHFNYVAKEFQRKGLSFVKFNFSHNGGTVDQPIDFPDLEAFGNNNFTKELDDLGIVIDWCEKNISYSKLILLGHSRGGGITILKAAEDKRVEKIITWAAVSNFKSRFPKDEILKWKNDGVTYVTNTRTHQEMPLYFQLYDDLVCNEARLDIEKASKSIEIPHLIIHGGGDEVVNVSEAYDINKWSIHSDLITIEDGGHTFGAQHPFNETKDELHLHAEEVIRDSIAFSLS